MLQFLQIILKDTITKQKSTFELQEDLEINRFLELDINVQCVELTKSGKAVDNVNDLEIVKEYIKNRSQILILNILDFRFLIC